MPSSAAPAEAPSEPMALVAQAKPRVAAVASAEAGQPVPPPKPATPPEPSFEVGESPVRAFARHSDLQFTAESSFSRVDGSGINSNSTARLLSNLNLGGDLHWRQHWSEKLQTRLGIGFSRIDFQGAPNSKTIDQRGKTFGRLGLGADYRLADRWQIGAGVGVRQEVFYTATGATSLRVDQVAVPRLEASVRYDLVELHPFRLGVGARSAYLFPTGADGYDVKAGSSHRASLHIQEENMAGGAMPAGEIFYDWKKQNTNLNRKTEKELGLRLGITWKFGP